MAILLILINVMFTVNIRGHEANFYEAEARKNEAKAEWFGLEALTSVVLCWLCPWWQPKKHLVSTHVLFEVILKVAQQGQHRRGRRTVVRGMIQLLLLVACYL